MPAMANNKEIHDLQSVGMIVFPKYILRGPKRGSLGIQEAAKNNFQSIQGNDSKGAISM